MKPKPPERQYRLGDDGFLHLLRPQSEQCYCNKPGLSLTSGEGADFDILDRGCVSEYIRSFDPAGHEAVMKEYDQSLSKA